MAAMVVMTVATAVATAAEATVVEARMEAESGTAKVAA